MKGKVNCTCGWSWNKSDSSAKDMYICHECGRDNSNNMKNGGWLDNYNDSQASAPEGMVGDGFSNVGRNYSPAWGGQFQNGGKTPLYVESKNDPRYIAYQDSLALYKGSNQERVNKLLAQGFKYDVDKKSKSKNYIFTNKDKKDYQKGQVNPKKGLQKIIQDGNDGKKDSALGGKDDKNAQYELMHGKIAPIGVAPLYDDWWRTSQYLYETKNNNTLPGSIYDKDQKNFRKNPHYKAPYAIDKTGKVLRNFFNVPLYKKPNLEVRVGEPSEEDLSINLQEPVIQNNLQPIGIQNDFNIEASLPVIRPQARIPKSFDITSQRQTMSGPSDYYNYNQQGLSIEQALEAKRAADAYNQSIQDKYGNSKNPKAQERLKQLMQNVELTPNYQMGGNVYPVNYVHQAAMGASMPGSVGFTYARTKGIPSNGPYAKKTLASAQNGKEMQYYQNGLDFKPKSISRDGGWLNKYEQAQNGKKKFKLKDERLQAIRPSESTFVKKPNFEAEQAKVQRTYVDQVGKQMAEEKRRKKLTKDQREREDYNARNEQTGSIQAHVPESTWDRTKAIVSNPLTAIGYKVRGENLPERFQFGPRNEHDYALDWVNPLQGLVALSEIPGELGRGEFLEAGLSGLDALDLGVYARGAKKALKPVVKKGLQQLKNIPTSIAPELRQGLRTNGPSFGSKIKPTFPEGYNLTPDESGNRYWLNNNNKQVGQVEYMSPTVDTQGRNWGSINIEIDPRHRGKGLSAPMYQQMLDHAEQQGHHGIMSMDNSLQSPMQSKAIRKYFNGKYSEDSNLLKNINESIDENNKFIQEENVRWGENEPLDPYESNVYLMSNKNKFEQGGIIKDDMGYWNPDNWDSPVEIGSNEITMQDVPFDVLGISDEGDVKHMKANNPKNYKYKGKKVTEFRMAKNGLRQEQKGLVNLDNLLNFTNYNTKQPGGWLDNL